MAPLGAKREKHPITADGGSGSLSPALIFCFRKELTHKTRFYRQARTTVGEEPVFQTVFFQYACSSIHTNSPTLLLDFPHNSYPFFAMEEGKGGSCFSLCPFF